jgi:hypothetical protein
MQFELFENEERSEMNWLLELLGYRGRDYHGDAKLGKANYIDEWPSY